MSKDKIQNAIDAASEEYLEKETVSLKVIKEEFGTLKALRARFDKGVALLAEGKELGLASPTMIKALAARQAELQGHIDAWFKEEAN